MAAVTPIMRTESDKVQMVTQSLNPDGTPSPEVAMQHSFMEDEVLMTPMMGTESDEVQTVTESLHQNVSHSVDVAMQHNSMENGALVTPMMSTQSDEVQTITESLKKNDGPLHRLAIEYNSMAARARVTPMTRTVADEVQMVTESLNQYDPRSSGVVQHEATEAPLPVSKSVTGKSWVTDSKPSTPVSSDRNVDDDIGTCKGHDSNVVVTVYFYVGRDRKPYVLIDKTFSNKDFRDFAALVSHTNIHTFFPIFKSTKAFAFKYSNFKLNATAGYIAATPSLPVRSDDLCGTFVLKSIPVSVETNSTTIMELVNELLFAADHQEFSSRHLFRGKSLHLFRGKSLHLFIGKSRHLFRGKSRHLFRGKK